MATHWSDVPPLQAFRASECIADNVKKDKVRRNWCIVTILRIGLLFVRLISIIFVISIRRHRSSPTQFRNGCSRSRRPIIYRHFEKCPEKCRSVRDKYGSHRRDRPDTVPVNPSDGSGRYDCPGGTAERRDGRHPPLAA